MVVIDIEEEYGEMEEADAASPYSYMDYDGESLTFRKQKNRDGGTFLSCEYQGQGPVHFSGSDAVVRAAVAMLVRGADLEDDGINRAVWELLDVVYVTEGARKFKMGQVVEVFDAYQEEWTPAEIRAFRDDGGYAVQQQGCGVDITYPETEIRLPQ